MTRLLWLAGLVVSAVLLALMILWPHHRARGLVVYSALDYAGPVARAFTHDTGIPVTVVHLSTGALIAKVMAEGQHPSWSIAWFDGDDAADGLARAGLLHSTLPAPSAASKALDTVESDGGAWVPTGVTLGGVFVVPASASLPATLPWRALAHWQGRVGMNNPAVSGPAYPMLAALLAENGGWPAGTTAILALKHSGLRVYTKNANTLAALARGDVSLALVQSSAAYAYCAHHPGFRVVLPRPTFALPSVMVFPRSASTVRVARALRFARFVNSAQGNRLRIGDDVPDSYYWPVGNTGVNPHPPLPAFATLTVEHLDPSQWGHRQAEVTEWFSHALGLE